MTYEILKEETVNLFTVLQSKLITILREDGIKIAVNIGLPQSSKNQKQEMIDWAVTQNYKS